MNDRRFRDRLVDRAGFANVSLSPDVVDRLETYYSLLSRWNKRINLTAFSLDDYTDQALDRLLIEPVAAAGFLEDSPFDWYDLGSGGGSPAIPMKIVRPSPRLTMVEARSRKAAFLREVARELALADVSVIADRFETVASRAEFTPSADVITARAVRQDLPFFQAARRLMKPSGRLILFVTETGGGFSKLFRLEKTKKLIQTGNSELAIYEAL